MTETMMPLPAMAQDLVLGVGTSVPPAVLLANHLKALKLPTFVREYEKVALEAAQGRADYPRYLLRLCELERIDRERRMVERRIRMAKFPNTKSFDTFDFTAQPSLNKPLVLELARAIYHFFMQGPPFNVNKLAGEPAGHAYIAQPYQH